MATETEQLVVSLEARIRDFEKNFQKANRTANTNFTAIEKRAKQSGDRLEQSMAGASNRISASFGIMKAGIAGLVAGVSIGALDAIISRTRDIARNVASIGNEAKRAGLSTKAFQELSYVANQNRISVDALVDGMKELNLRADEFVVTGKGAAAEAFQRLGFGADELKKKLKDPSALLVEIMKRMEGLGKAAQIRIADELFGGTGGERFVELLDRGADGIRTLISEANQLGIILDDDVIARADEIDRKFTRITQTIGTGLKGAVVDVVAAMDDWLDRFNKIEEQTDRNVQSSLTGVYERIAAAKAELADLDQMKVAFPDDAAVDLNIDRQKEKIEELTNEALKLRDILDRRTGYSPDFDFKKTTDDAKAASDAVNGLNSSLTGTGNATAAGATGINSYADAIRALKDEIPELAKSLAELDAKTRIDSVYRAAVAKARTIGEIQQANALHAQATAAIGKPSPAVTGGASNVTDASDRARDYARQQIAAYSDIIASAQEFIASQQQEATALGMTTDAAAAYRFEQDMLNQAKRDGITLSAEQRADIAAYAQGMAHAEKVTQDLAKSQDDAAEISKFFGDSMVDALTGIATGTMTAQEALRQLLSSLIRMAFQAAILGEGPLAGMFGSTGGLFRSGGQSISRAPTFAAPVGKDAVADAVMTSLAPIAKAAGPLGDMLAAVRYSNGGATRNMKLDAALEAKISEAVGAVYGKDYVAEVYSGGQPAIGTSGRRTGSTRHDLGNAADIYVRDQLGNKVTGDRLGPLAQYWQAKGYGGTGLEMRGGGIHLDQHNDRARFWDYSSKGGRITQAQIDAVRAGQQGIMPGMATPDPMANAYAAQGAQQEAQKALQDQIEAQRRLAEQMAATRQATQSMTPPIQNIGQAASQVAPNLSSVTQGMTGLLAPLSQAIPGLGQFGGAIQALIQQLLAMPMGGSGGGLLGSLFGFADGGHVRGPGTSTSDSIPALLSDGEYVVNAAATQRNRALLEAINSGGVPRLASGGPANGRGYVGGPRVTNTTTFSPKIEVRTQGSSGDAKKDAQHAEAVAAAVDKAFEVKAAEWARNQMRSGGVLTMRELRS